MTLAAAPIDPLVAQYLLASRAENTRRAYASDLKHFAAWGGTIPSTADELSRYLAHHAEVHRPSTLRRHLAAIASAHRDLGLVDPTKAPFVARVVQGIQRRHGNLPVQVAPLLIDDVARIVARFGTSPRDLRDRAVLLVGFFGALRRSEIVELDFDAVEFCGAAARLKLCRCKTDQTAMGRVVYLAARNDGLCPVLALTSFVASAEKYGGPLFSGGTWAKRLSARTVARIIKRLVSGVGLDPSAFSGHSLRAGFVTSAALVGFDAPLIAKQTGHRSLQSLSAYVRMTNFPGLPSAQQPSQASCS